MPTQPTLNRVALSPNQKMILVYRPELESPPMDKECTIGFSFITGKGSPDYISVSAGVTRDFPEDVWDQIRGYDVVKNLLSLGALRIQEEEPTTIPAPESDAGASHDSINNIALPQAMDLIEASYDIDQLQRWLAKENRIKVRNSIAKRITAITEGNS